MYLIRLDLYLVLQDPHGLVPPADLGPQHIAELVRRVGRGRHLAGAPGTHPPEDRPGQHGRLPDAVAGLHAQARLCHQGHHGFRLPRLRLRAHHLSDEFHRVDRPFDDLFSNFFVLGTHDALFRSKGGGGGSVNRAETLGDVMMGQHLAGVPLSLSQGLEAHDLDHIHAVVFRILDHANRPLVGLQVDGVEQIASHGQHPHFSITTAAAKNEGGGRRSGPHPLAAAAIEAGGGAIQGPNRPITS